jgi:hypothetical protein
VALLELKKDASARELAWFGVLLAAFAGVVGGLVWWSTGHLTVSRFIWGAGAVVAGVYYLVPPVRRPIFMGWMYASYPIGWVVSHVLLATIYFVIFTLIGLIMRAVGYDPLARRFDRTAKSYWVRREPISGVERYFRQF